MRTDAVVVGVDGSHRSDAAVLWAADEAAERQAQLLVVHAIDVNGVAPWTTTRSMRDELRAMWRPVVDRCVDLVHGRHPNLVVDRRVLIGSPIRTLLAISKTAPLVVLGRDGRGALARTWLGNVPQRVLAHAQCPVVAVGPAPSTQPDHITRVIVGCADDEVDPTVLQFGFEIANRRSVPLLAVHAVHQPAGIVLPAGKSAVYADAVIDAEKRLEKELSEWRARYPDVHVVKIARTGHAADVLTEGGRPHDLIVVGHHHHAPVSFRQLGCNTSAILHSAECSVAVIHFDSVAVPAVDST